MRAALAALLVLLAGAAASAGDLPTAADVTERGRTLDYVLDGVLLPRSPPPEEGRTVVLVVDPTESLRAAGFAGALRSAFRRNRARLAETRFAVVRVDGAGPPELPPTDDLDRVEAAFRAIAAAPVRDLQNVYAAVRRAVDLLAAAPGAREVVLVTLENGDAEDDLEVTVAAAREAGVTVSAVAREAFLSDTWWFRRPRADLGGLKVGGADSAFIELPWSYLLQWTPANEAVASGFAIYGISRLAAATGGRVWLHYPEAAAASRCVPAGPGHRCPFCAGDHLSCGESYRAHRLREIAPLVASREEVGRAMARDPAFRAVQTAWIRAAKEGVMLFEPSVSWSANGFREADLEAGNRVLLGDSLAFEPQARRADRLAKACAAIVDELDRELGFAGEEASPRYRAMADTMRIQLLLTRLNLRSFAAFCREVGEAWREDDPAAWPAPEVPPLRSDYTYTRIWFVDLSLCHGAAPFAELRRPGGRDLDRELEAFRAEAEAFLARRAHTPFAQVLRRQGIAEFHLLGHLTAGLPAPRWIPKSGSGSTATPPPERPPRGGPSGGSGGGTSSSGSGR